MIVFPLKLQMAMSQPYILVTLVLHLILHYSSQHYITTRLSGCHSLEHDIKLIEQLKVTFL